MKRKLMILAVLAVLATPLMARAYDLGDIVIPPEMNWTPYPPASKTVDVVQLAELLLAKGMITDQEYAQLTHPQATMSSAQSRDTAEQTGAAYRNPGQTMR